MDEDIRYVFLYIDKKLLMDEFLEKLSSKGYKLQEYKVEGHINYKYDENEFSSIIINKEELNGSGGSLKHKHYWFFKTKLSTNSFFKTKQEIRYNPTYKSVDIAIHNLISEEMLQKVNKIFQKEFGFVLGDKKIINFI